MIKLLSEKFRKHISWPLFIIFYLQLVLPFHAQAKLFERNFYAGYTTPGYNFLLKDSKPGKMVNRKAPASLAKPTVMLKKSPAKVFTASFIGGPNAPEASSFKPVDANNLVNLATGDFSYSIPLMDVGGYPVNLFYNGGITMEQEASWVGLGWNINPGTVNRNMRGVPDDFNGTDQLIQTQNVKPNRTWGGDVALDIEYVGLKAPKIGIGGSLGFSYNNYLGPALEIGSRVSLSISTSQNVTAEKAASMEVGNDTSKFATSSSGNSPGSSAGITASLGTKLSSRSGLTFSPSISANVALADIGVGLGAGLSTSYNSRTGIKELNISSSQSLPVPGNVYQYLSKLFRSETTITFAKPSYLPTLRMPMENANYSGQLELGFGFFGFRGSVTALGYYSESKVPAELRRVTKPLVGYMYSEKAAENANAVMDFNRLNDAEVTPRTPIISAPQYNYDVFSVQGEGTGGSIRAYRGDLGFVRDNVTMSKDKNISVGIDLGVPFHLGINWNTISTPTRVGGWDDANNTLSQTMTFKPGKINSSFENIYFKNPGEATVTNPEILNRVGGDNLVRFKLEGSKAVPRLSSTLEQFNKMTGTALPDLPVAASSNLANRDKRTQVITMLNAKDAAQVGLDTSIRNYTGAFDLDNNIVYENISRVGGMRKEHHISEIDVLEQSGMRYVYGLPVYNVVQKDFTFSVDGLPDANNIVSFAADEPTTSSHAMQNKSKVDGYVTTQEIPAYAASFLITGLLSPDYVDVTGNGITEDDLGGSVKFNYNKSSDLHKWRTPRNNSTAATASFNEGTRTEKRDNKATIVYGERESWYLNSIESKSMVAIFKTDYNRNDAKGVNGPLDGGINATEHANKRLVQIDLYTKSEIKSKGYSSARPVKSVFFTYDSSLCMGTPDSKSGGGKLTLKSIHFTYNGQNRNVKSRYVFNYGNLASAADNPVYKYNASDRWGTYKPKTDPVTSLDNNPSGLNNIDFPYTTTDKAKNNRYAGAWSLKKVLLPSGGQMEVEYEADNYGYVQNRRACDMFVIHGLGKTTSYGTDNGLYNNGLSSSDNEYLYVKLPTPLKETGTAGLRKEIFAKYLEDIGKLGDKYQLAVKMLVNMPKGPEPLTVYPEYDDWGVCANSVNKDYIYIHLKGVEGKSPLAKSSIGFLTANIPGQAFEGYDVEVDGISAFVEMAGGMLTSLKGAFKNVDQQMRSGAKGRTIDLSKSFVRLANPGKIKFGGGHRVKKVLVRDNWNKMSGQYNSVYGQEYDYTQVDKINDRDTVISSGVASYEPGIGSEENPFRSILSFNNKLPLASAEYGSIEMPMLEGLYPSPSVVYSKVTTRSIHRKGTHGDSAVRSAIGKQVSEFYTAKDYPSYSTYTFMNNVEYKKTPFFSFFYKEIINRRAISQGFLVETNDMHGKIKSQEAFSESDDRTPLSASYHSYKNTGKNGLNDKVDYVYNEEGGVIKKGNIGIDVELMTDVREFSVRSNGFNGQIQIDLYTFGPITIPLPTFYPLKTYVENKYKAVTCTKLINYHAVEDSVIIMDKGSVVSTKTIVYDSETGSPIVSKTANEFNDSIYNLNYPAYWAYGGTGLAYKNIGREFKNVNFVNGRITNVDIDQNAVFESGDELFLFQKSTGGSMGCMPQSADVKKLWALDTTKNSSSLIQTAKHFIFIDKDGNPFTKTGANIRIIRSGKRNNLGLSVASVTSMVSPVQVAGPVRKLVVNSNSDVVGASVTELKEKWQADNDLFKRYVYSIDYCSGTETQTPACNGELVRNINPYLKGMLGSFKSHQSRVFYGNRKQSDPSVATRISKDGALDSFKLYWDFNNDHNLVPDLASTKWVWNSEITRINSKGQELETRDALNIYTAAQYAFSKNLPVALTKNSRYDEMAYAGFEDNFYNETINHGTTDSCARPHFDLSGLTNSSIVNMELNPIKAHTGKYVMAVIPNDTAKKTFPLPPDPVYVYDVTPKNDTTKTLVDFGGVVDTLFVSQPSPPLSLTPSPYALSLGIMGLGCHGSYSHTNSNGQFVYYTKASYLITVPTDGYYDWLFTWNFTTSVVDGGSSGPYLGAKGFEIFDMGGNLAGSYMGCTSIPAASGSCSPSTYLCSGIYKVVITAEADHSGQANPNNQGGIDITSNDQLSLTCTNAIIPGYVSLTTASGCAYTKPIAAKDSMINPVFNIPAYKKMVFSGWVREHCGTGVPPCTLTTYTQNKVVLTFDDGSSLPVELLPSGTIIEGWQRYDAVFTRPSGASSMTMNFVNNSSDSIYFDDIRIHPYNGNMKSYVYDPRTLRLVAELDENNYASFYEYDEEGQLVRVKKETIQGIKTIKETRTARQRGITDVQTY